MSNKIAQFMFDRTGVPKLEKYLDLASLRHKLKAGNIANSASPGYKSRDIDFASEFARLTGNSRRLAGTTTHKNHLPTGASQERSPKVNEIKPVEGELNSVDVDVEISDMAQNELLFTIGAKLLQSKFEGLRKAITNR